MKNNFKIIIHPETSDDSDVSFYCNNGHIGATFKFINNSIIIAPSIKNYQEQGSIFLMAKRNNKQVVVPVPMNDSLFSNRIYFSDVNEDDPDDKPWNVLELKVTINNNMFSFTTLPPFILKGRELIEQSPVYKLVSQ